MSPDVDFKEKEDECESGSAGNLYRIVIAVTSHRKVTDLVQGCSDHEQVLCLFTREVFLRRGSWFRAQLPSNSTPKPQW